MNKAERKAERMELRRRAGQRLPRPPVSSARPKSPYHLAHVCFRCRRSTKLAPSKSAERRCSKCAGPLFEMGRSFRAPAAADAEQWLKVQTLYAHGFRFVGTGWHNGPALPERLRDVAEFVRENRDHPLRRGDTVPELLPPRARKR